MAALPSRSAAMAFRAPEDSSAIMIQGGKVNRAAHSTRVKVDYSVPPDRLLFVSPTLMIGELIVTSIISAIL